MDIERFERLIEAYGADPKRWPAEEREAARALAHANAERCGPLLETAHELDLAMDCAPVGAPSLALRERVIEAAPRGRHRRLDASSRWLWWPGLAAACAAGVLAGVVVTDQATRGVRADTVLAANTELALAETTDGMEAVR